MKEAVEVKSGLTVSLEGLRILRVIEEPIGIFILRADYAIGMTFDLVTGEEDQIRELYDRITGAIFSNGEALAPMPNEVYDMIVKRRILGKGGM